VLDRHPERLLGVCVEGREGREGDEELNCVEGNEASGRHIDERPDAKLLGHDLHAPNVEQTTNVQRKGTSKPSVQLVELVPRFLCLCQDLLAKRQILSLMQLHKYFECKFYNFHKIFTQPGSLRSLSLCSVLPLPLLEQSVSARLVRGRIRN
jgi:hypothetical protein